MATLCWIVCGAIFPTVFADFLSLCPLWQFSQYFKLYHYYCVWYGDLRWSLVLDVTIALFWWCPKLHPCSKTANMFNEHCVSWLLCQAAAPQSLSLLRSHCSLRHNSSEIRPVEKPTMASKSSSEESVDGAHFIVVCCRKVPRPRRHPGQSAAVNTKARPSTSQRLRLTKDSEDGQQFLAIQYFSS